MKNTLKRMSAVLLVLTVLLTVCLVPAAAATKLTKCKKTYKNYCIIGDSVASGYALTEDLDPYAYEHQQYHPHNDIPDGSYPQLVSKAIKAKSVYKLAREGWSVPNVLRLIDPEYDKELARPENYYTRFVTEYMYWNHAYNCNNPDTEDLDYLKKTAVDGIKNADIITINLGNNDIFTNAALDGYIRTLYYSYGMASQPGLTMMKDCYTPITTVDQVVQMVGSYKDLLTLVDENFEKYKVNYDKLVGRILEINPDADIYVIGMYNLFGQEEPKSELQQFLEDKNLEVMAELKQLYTKDSKYADKVTYVPVPDTEVWPTSPMYSVDYYTNFFVHFHPDYNGHRYMANQIIKTINKNA